MGFWDIVAPVYDLLESVNGRVYRKMLGYSASLVKEGDRVLECAAGTAEISIAVSEKASHILCTDMSEGMLERAKKKCRKKGISNIDFAERNIFELPEEDETYDVVIAANVLHLVENPEKAVVLPANIPFIRSVSSFENLDVTKISGQIPEYIPVISSI